MRSRVSCLIGVGIRVGAEAEEEGAGGAIKLKDKSYVLSAEAGCKPQKGWPVSEEQVIRTSSESKARVSR